MAKYTSQFGKAHLVYGDFLNLYLQAIVGSEQPALALNDSNSIAQLEQHRATEIQTVWRDIRNHGIVGPAEFERNMKLAELQSKPGLAVVHDDDDDDDILASQNMLDECEILEESLAATTSQVSMTTDRQGKSSHERVELVPGRTNTNVPLWVQDGDFGTCVRRNCSCPFFMYRLTFYIGRLLLSLFPL